MIQGFRKKEIKILNIFSTIFLLITSLIIITKLLKNTGLCVRSDIKELEIIINKHNLNKKENNATSVNLLIKFILQQN